MLDQVFQQVRVVVDTELVRDGDQHGVGCGDRLVLGEVRHELVGFTGVGLAEPGDTTVDVPHLVLAA